MCGIAGILGPGGGADAGRRIDAMVRGLANRGPDDAGTWFGDEAALGFARLAIIDTDARSNQPMAWGGSTMVFNGEIYNYLEIRKELEAIGHRFETRGDTEVLLHAWCEWGEACLRRLIGMFAFVVVDTQRGLAHCVRDAFGIKPLFYRSDPDATAFCSDLMVLRADDRGVPQLDAARALEYLIAGRYDGGEGTFLSGYRQVAPACLVEVDLATGRVGDQRRWWTPSIEPEPYANREEAVERAREMLLDSVRLHLRSDVPLGVALSGGIDSSSITCAVRHLEPDASIQAIAYVAPGFEGDEARWSSLVADATGAHLVTTTIDAGIDVPAMLDDVIIAQGEPFGSPSIVAQYQVFRAAREAGLTVMLEGQGADELFCGYQGYPGCRVATLLDDRRPLAAIQYARAWREWPGRASAEMLRELGAVVLNGAGPDWLYGRVGIPVPEWITAGGAPGATASAFRRPRRRPGVGARHRRVAFVARDTVLEDGLARLLRHGDRSSMRWSVESRVPFLTLPLAEFALRLPEDIVVSPTGESKSLLRDAMSGIVPEAVLRRRDKVGFATPQAAWISRHDDVFRGWLAEGADLEVLDRDRVSGAIDDVASGRRADTTSLWRALNLCRWATLAGVGSAASSWSTAAARR